MRTLSALSLFLVLVLAAAPAQAVTTLAAALNGANERPTAGDTDGPLGAPICIWQICAAPT